MRKRFIRRRGSFSFVAFLFVSLIFATIGWIAIDSDWAFGAKKSISSEVAFVPALKVKKMINLSFHDEKKQKRYLSQYKEKVVLLYIWGSWCPQCVHDLQTLDDLQVEFGPDKFMALPLALDQGDLSFLQKYYEKNMIETLPIFQDTNGQSLVDLDHVKDLPTIILIDKKGVEKGRFQKPISETTAIVRQKIEELL